MASIVLGGWVATVSGQIAPAPKEPPPCGSVVVVRCESPPSGLARPADVARRTDDRLRSSSDPFELDRIVIEADRARRSFEDAMAGAFPRQPEQGMRTFATNEGSLCSCLNRCPPFPLPCCQCAPHTNRYTTSPGASLLR